jgi:hypothetical protein
LKQDKYPLHWQTTASLHSAGQAEAGHGVTGRSFSAPPVQKMNNSGN